MTPEERAAEIAEAENRWNPFIERYGLRNMNHEELARLIAAAIRDAVEAEREACAQEVRRLARYIENETTAAALAMHAALTKAAATIEARGQETTPHAPPPQG